MSDDTNSQTFDNISQRNPKTITNKNGETIINPHYIDYNDEKILMVENMLNTKNWDIIPDTLKTLTVPKVNQLFIYVMFKIMDNNNSFGDNEKQSFYALCEHIKINLNSETVPY